MTFGLPSLPSFLSFGSSRDVSSTPHDAPAGKSNGADAATTQGQKSHQPSGALAGLGGKPAASSGPRAGFKVGPKIKLSTNTRNAIASAKSRNLESDAGQHPGGPLVPYHGHGEHPAQFAEFDSASSSMGSHASEVGLHHDSHSVIEQKESSDKHGPIGPGGNPPPPEPPNDGSPVKTAKADSDSMINQSIELQRINMETNNALAQIQNRMQLNMSLNQVSEQLGKNATSLTRG